MKRVLFWGATGQAKVLRDALRGEAQLVAIFDNREVPAPFPDIPVFRGEAGLAAWESGVTNDGPVHACVAIGGGRGRDRLQLQRWLADRGYPPLTVIHPTAFVSDDAIVGAGCQVLAQASVCAAAFLGEAVIVNTGASVDHDCRIGAGAHIAPGAVLAGEVDVGEHAFVGAGAVVLPRIRIGAEAVIGAGAVVTRDVAPGIVVTGNPARPHDNATSRQA